MARINGSSAINRLRGTSLSDTIYGLGGNDFLYGGAGNDLIYGGTGNDRLYGEAGNDKLYGESGADTLSGGDGNDTLTGGSENDRLYGDGGNDALDGGLGADALSGGLGIDTLRYSGATSGISIWLDNAFAAAGFAAGDTFSGIEIVHGTGSGDSLNGDAADNTFYGYGGDDTLAGGTGSDTLYGGDGDDILTPGEDSVADWIYGGDGEDAVDYTGSATPVTVNLVTGINMGGAAGDTMSSIESVFGSDSLDELTVGRGGMADGGLGADTLSGSTDTARPSIETLTGGDGNDYFTLHLDAGADIITDFDPADILGPDADRFLVFASEFAGLTSDVVRYVDTSVDALASNIPAAQFVFDSQTDILYFDADGNGMASSLVAVAMLPGYTGDMIDGDFVVL